MDTSINDPVQQATEFLDFQTENDKIPGIQYVVVDSGGIILNYASGFSDIGSREALEPSSTMMAYSMTKTYTAVAMLQLTESGKVGLDDPLIKYLPDMPYGGGITIRHLIAHTSGIPNPVPLRWAHLPEDHASYDEVAELAAVLEMNNKLKFEPGKKYLYSNIGYWLLGQIVEKVTQVPFSEYMQNEIAAPLGLNNGELAFTITNPESHARGYLAKFSFLNLVKGFMLDEGLIGDYEGDWLHINNHYLNGPAFGGLIGSAQDFARFLQDQLKPQSVLLGADMKALLYTRQANNEGEAVEMTLGWHVGSLDGQAYYFKEGGGGGYHCEMRVYPASGIGTVIMVNRTSFSSKKYLNKVDEAFLADQSNAD